MTNLKMRTIGQDLGRELENDLNTRIEISYCNEDYEGDKEFIVYIYSNKYDYKKVYLNYLEGISSTNEYFTAVKYALIQGEFYVHTASAEEKYIQEVLESTGVTNLYISDGCLCSTKNECDDIGLDYIDSIKYNKAERMIEITVIEEKFKIDLVNETITYREENNVESIAMDSINRVVDIWNKLNYWCSLGLKDDSIVLLDNESNNSGKIVDISNIDILNLKDNVVNIQFLKADEHGFDCCSINQYGIEY
ncbi:hypothetical protein [Clostridium sp. DJ247]|uniref:hypothetical protein n=1 Tax=Clostridium sp. DJ247 TaxID=2726188 RepID=UPI0016258215|nr:hypothetical protein [Clostridium sp. DJ247]MBC2580844.1 hypothetical protein [Clostridium sp. DJ247]